MKSCFAVLGRLIKAVSSADYAPRFAAIERLQDRIASPDCSHGPLATLAGCAFERDGHLLWIYREAGRLGFPTVKAAPGECLVWDNRFLIDVKFQAKQAGYVCAIGDLREKMDRGLDDSRFAELYSNGYPKRAIESVPAFVLDDLIVQIAGGFTEIQSNPCETVSISSYSP